MIKISPFKALRPEAQFAKQVAARPYDVLNSKEAKIEAQGNPSSYLHITKSEIDLPENTDPYDKQVYEKAKENLEAFISRNILFRENKPCYYIYRLIMPGPLANGLAHTQSGLVAGSSVSDYENGLIKKHEFTRPDKEQDRINHIMTTGAQTGNVFLAYREVEEIDILIENWQKERSAVYDFTADDGIQHTIWIINDETAIANISTLFTKYVSHSYIADGHHRAASAAKVCTALEGDAAPGSEIFLTTLFPANQLKIMDYNRVIKDLNAHDAETFLQKVGEKFEVESSAIAVQPGKLHEFGMFLNNSWYKLTAKEGTYTTDPIGVLDISVLQNHLLSPILGIGDQRTDKRIDFVGGIRGVQELEKRVGSGEMAVAFSIFPVTIHQLFDIADSGNVMPPKSTWFEPKLRDGLLTHLING
ncbi:MAG: DUF1015 family protein [Chitinophagaceae bacterium]